MLQKAESLTLLLEDVLKVLKDIILHFYTGLSATPNQVLVMY